MMGSPKVYDKAKWHYERDYPDALPESQAFVHIGIFLAWAINHNMYSEEFHNGFCEGIAALHHRQITGAKLLQRADGVFADDMMNDEGNAFTRYYFRISDPRGGYLSDYDGVFSPLYTTLYHVADTWESYEKIKPILDRRYQEWIGAGRPHLEEVAPLQPRATPPRRIWRRRYVTYLVLGRSNPLHVYDWPAWQTIVHSLEPIIGVTRGKVGVRCTQLHCLRHKPVSFGQLSWDEKSHMRWTHGSPLTREKSDEWSFFGTEIWAPHWKMCEQEDLAPDVFMSIHAESHAEAKPFDQELLIAVHEDAPRAVLEYDLPRAVHRIAEVMHGALTATTIAQWGRPTSGGIGYADALQDFLEWGLYHARLDHQVPIVSLLPGDWRQVES